MADLSIYSQFLRPVRSVADYDREARAGELDQLQLLAARDQRAATQRQVQRGDQLQSLMRGLPAGATDDDRVAALRGGAFFDQADALEKGVGERAKTRASVAETEGKTRKGDYELQRQKYEHVVGGLRQFQQPEDARQWLADSVAGGAMPMQAAQQMISRVPRDPAAFGTWRDETLMSVLDAAKQAGFAMPDANAKLSAATQAAGQAATTARADADRTQRATEAAAGRQVQREGIAATDRRATAALEAATKRGSGPGKMSATLQKELIESDDLAATAQGTVDTLNQALKINDKAYSGYGASTRAKVRSNLPGKDASADATIELENLIGTQALAGMKAIFGGNPTEGERAILLELQASADKTPKQRAAIITRGIAAANRRAALSKERAKSIRGGTYLSDGADATDEPSVDDLLTKYGNP